MRQDFVCMIFLAWMAAGVAGCSRNSASNSSPLPTNTTSLEKTPSTDRDGMPEAEKNAVATSLDYGEFLSNYPLFKKLQPELTMGGRADIYTFHLHHAGEPDLVTVREKKGEAYRLITMDGGARISNIYRIEKINNQTTLTAKKVDTIGLHNGMPADVDVSPPLKLTDKEWLEFQALLDRVTFWGLPTGNTVFGLDGSFYLAEGVTPTKHHLVARWSEVPATYLALFDYLANLAEQGAAAKGASAPPALPGQ